MVTKNSTGTIIKRMVDRIKSPQITRLGARSSLPYRPSFLFIQTRATCNTDSTNVNVMSVELALNRDLVSCRVDVNLELIITTELGPPSNLENSSLDFSSKLFPQSAI